MILNYGNLNEKIVEKSNVLAFLSMGAVLLVLTLAIYRRIQSFKFISIDSNFTVNDNIALIRQFLQNQNIAFYHNPRAVEVFQISSRILDVQYGQREIMVFIADENRILINSHFTSLVGDRGLKEISSSGHKIMAKELRKWLLNQENNRTTQFNLKKMGT
jgi:hypothetical protein